MLLWFKQLANKGDSAFICFGVVESITEALLKLALDLTSEHVNISVDERQAVINSKHSLLFSKGQRWEKKTSTSNFDVTMRSSNEAETCVLVGSYLLSQIGLYRDVGLAILNHTPREMEKAKKQICQIFANNNLKITADVNKKVVNFLDVTLDLNNGKFKPYSKPSTTPLYVHSQSNHPPNILKNIPETINRRLSGISSDHEVFNEAAAPYQEALRKSDYTLKL